MKNLIRTTALIFSIFTFILACTKEISLKTEVEFSVIEQHVASGYVDQDLSTTITVVPEAILEEFSYSYSYSVTDGNGHFRNRSGEIVPQNENIALNPLTATIMYVGSESGEHIVRVIATDNYGFTEEVEIEYTLAEIPPVVWTATSPVKRIELGNSAQITVNFEKSEANTEVNYERRYRLVAGSGELTAVSSQAIVDNNEFQPITSGTYELNFTPEDLGVMELSFDLKGDDGEEFRAELSFEVLEEIADTVAPETILLGDNPLIVTTGSIYLDPGATATDDVDGDISENIVIDAFDVNTSVSGSYQVTYNVNDSSGNVADEVVRTVEVTAWDDLRNSDNTILEFEIQGQNTATIINEVDHTVTMNVPFGTEVMVAPIVLIISADATVTPTMSAQQNYANPVTYVVKAENGEIQEWVVSVRINDPIDTTPPAITLTGDNPQIIEVGQAYSELGATATDNFDGNLTEGIIVNSGTVNTNLVGDYTVTYNVSDAAGNTAAQITRTVRVADTTPPVITISNGSLSIAVGDSYIEPGYSATDNLDGNITGNVMVGGNLDTNTVGNYTVTYDVTDNQGNAAVQATRTVEVIDTTVPVIELTGSSVTMSVGQAYSEPGFSATDNYDGNITGNVTVGGNLNVNTVGTYTVTYDVRDTSLNAAVQKTRSVQVIDTTVPVITLVGGFTSVSVGQSYVDPGYSANDNVDGNLTGNVMFGGNLDTNTLGTYTVTYNVSDAAGNDAVQKSRAVQVIDTTPPVIFLSGGSVSLKVGRSYPEPGYSASDNIDGDLSGSVIVGGNLNTNAVGTYTVTYDISDASANSAIQKSRTVMVTPRVTSFDASTGIYTAPEGSEVTVSLFSGGSGSGTGAVNGGGRSANTCFGGAGSGSCSSADSYTFFMPASESVSFTASHSSGGGSSNSTGLTIASNDESQSYTMNVGAAGTSIPTN